VVADGGGTYARAVLLATAGQVPARKGQVALDERGFVGRVSVQARHPEALEGTAEDISAVVHGLAFAKVEESLAKGDLDDGIVFA
jgi:hypothetical protein